MDDILLVLEDTREFADEKAVRKWIVSRSNGILKLDKKKKAAVLMKADYLGRSVIEFAGNKQKVFLLEGESGKTLVSSIERQVSKRASEWRALPDIPDTADGLSADLALACDADGEPADNLRKADSVSLRRAGVAIRLRDIEAFEHDLLPAHWHAQRKAFFDTVKQHVLVLPRLFDFANYLPRLIGLAVACRDFNETAGMLERLEKSIKQIKGDCEISIAGEDKKATAGKQILLIWRKKLVQAISEALAIALPIPLRKAEREAFDEMLKSLHRIGSADGSTVIANTEIAEAWGKRLFLCDLGRIPFRLRCLPYELRNGKRPPSDNPQELPRTSCLLDDAILNGAKSFPSVQPDGPFPIPLLFPTRPFSIPELYLVASHAFDGKGTDILRSQILAFRGFLPKDGLPKRTDNTIIVPLDTSERKHGKLRIAIASWKTSKENWTASVSRMPDPDRTRYSRLNDLLNDILRKPQERLPQYIVLPELSVPAGWFLRLAGKLAMRGISLIAGVEYLHHGRKMVGNQVWVSLITDFLGFRSHIIYRQDKRRPAIHEEDQLWQVGGRRLKALTNAEKPCIHHGDLWFGLLICSELTNLDYRSRFRGKVDAVFVPEWNPDTESFSTLVESAAADIHSYIIQCNDRQYGDSRIRVPAKESHQRDLVRIKGGIEDYFVIGEIDIAALREFQSANRSPTGDTALFKPVPDGFVISKARRRLPKRDTSP